MGARSPRSKPGAYLPPHLRFKADEAERSKKAEDAMKARALEEEKAREARAKEQEVEHARRVEEAARIKAELEEHKERVRKARVFVFASSYMY